MQFMAMIEWMNENIQKNRNWPDDFQSNEKIDERDWSIAKLQRVKGRIVGMLFDFLYPIK